MSIQAIKKRRSSLKRSTKHTKYSLIPISGKNTIPLALTGRSNSALTLALVGAPTLMGTGVVLVVLVLPLSSILIVASQISLKLCLVAPIPQEHEGQQPACAGVPGIISSSQLR